MGKDGSQGASVGSRGASERLSTPKIGSGVASKTLAEEARALRALAKQAYKVCKTMIEKGVTYLQLLAAVEMVVGSEGRGLLERVVTLIMGLQKACLPASLICVRLTGDFGTDFEGLVVAFGRLVDDSGAMPKGWEKLKLPMNLNTNPEKHDQKGSETPSKEGTTSPQQVPLNSQVSPQQATATTPQASLDAANAHVLLERLWDSEIQQLNSVFPPGVWIGGSMPDDPVYTARLMDELNTLNKATTIVKIAE